MNEPVLLTGLGVASCLGQGREAFWQGLLAGRSRLERVPDGHANMPMPSMHLAGELPGEPAGTLAGVGLEAVPPERLAVVVGTGMGDARLDEQRRVGSVSNACAASGFALAVAADLIDCGEADVVVAGGAEVLGAALQGARAAHRIFHPRGSRPAALQDAGYHVVTFDLRNHGRSDGDRALGDMAERFASDPADVVALARADAQVGGADTSTLTEIWETYDGVWFM